MIGFSASESDVSHKEPGNFPKKQWPHVGTDIVEWALRMEWFILQIQGGTFGTFGQEGVERCASQNIHIVSLRVWISLKRENFGNKSRLLLVDKTTADPCGPQHFSTIHVISCHLDAGLCD